MAKWISAIAGTIFPSTDPQTNCVKAGSRAISFRSKAGRLAHPSSGVEVMALPKVSNVRWESPFAVKRSSNPSATRGAAKARAVTRLVSNCAPNGWSTIRSRCSLKRTPSSSISRPLEDSTFAIRVVQTVAIVESLAFAKRDQPSFRKSGAGLRGKAAAMFSSPSPLAMVSQQALSINRTTFPGKFGRCKRSSIRVLSGNDWNVSTQCITGLNCVVWPT